MNVVFPCTGAKRYPPTIQVSQFRTAEEWAQAVSSASPKYPIKDLYTGAYWREVLAVVSDFPEHDYWVLSAGLGIQPFDAMIPSYDATLSKRSLNTIPEEWIPHYRMTGVISTSNAYATMAERIGLTLIKPSGRRWLHHVGGTGFTLGPRLTRLFLSGVDLPALFASLPETTAQPLPRRKRATPEDIRRMLVPGITPQILRKRLNDSGLGLSVERSYLLVKEYNTLKNEAV